MGANLARLPAPARQRQVAGKAGPSKRSGGAGASGWVRDRRLTSPARVDPPAILSPKATTWSRTTMTTTSRRWRGPTRPSWISTSRRCSRRSSACARRFADAFTAQALGTERRGNGVVIGKDGLIVTIGYLITEAERVWVTTSHGIAAAAHVVAYDQGTGLGLIQALAPLGAAGAGPERRRRARARPAGDRRRRARPQRRAQRTPDRRDARSPATGNTTSMPPCSRPPPIRTGVVPPASARTAA